MDYVDSYYRSTVSQGAPRGRLDAELSYWSLRRRDALRERLTGARQPA